MSHTWIDSAIKELNADISVHKGIVESNLRSIKDYEQQIEKLKEKIKETSKRAENNMDRIEKLQKIVEGLKKIQETHL